MPIGSRRPFVGRHRELSTMTGLLTAATAGEPQILVMTGEAGAGKTRLLDVFCAHARHTARVLGGRCEFGDGGVPFGLFAPALLPVLDDPAADPRRRRAVRALIDSGPAAAEAAPSSRIRRFEAVLAALVDADRPTVLALDDVQWGDPSSLELLRFLTRTIAHQPFLLVLLWRQTGRPPPATRALAAGLRHDVRTTWLDLPPLTARELAELAASTTGQALRATDLDLLAEASHGNPFLAEQWLSAAAGEPRGTAVREMLLAEFHGLSATARRAVELLVVAGSRTDARILEHCLGQDAEAAVAEGAGLGFVERNETCYRVRHEIYAEAVREVLSPGAQRHRHEELAGAAEELAARGADDVLSPARIAWHWQQAAAWERAVPALLAAAREASAKLAFAEAYGLWCALVGLADKPRITMDRVDVLRGAARAARWTGRPAEAVDLVSRAMRLAGAGPAELRAGLHVQRAGYRRLTGATGDAMWDAERAAKLLGDGGSAQLQAEVAVERARLTTLSGDYRLGRKLAGIAVGLAEAAGDLALEGRAYDSLAISMYAADHEVDAAVAALRYAQRLSGDYGDLEENIRVCNNLAYIYGDCGQLPLCLTSSAEAVELARRAGLPALDGPAGVAQCNLINAQVLLGRWDQARAQLDVALAEADGDGLNRDWLAGTYAQLCAARGEFDRAHELLGRVDPAGAGDDFVRHGLAAAAAELACWQQRPAVALAAVRAELTDELTPADAAYLLVWGLRAAADLVAHYRIIGDPAGVDRATAEATAMLDDYGAGIRPDTVTELTEALIRAEHARGVRSPDEPGLWRRVRELATDQPFAHAYASFRLVAADPAGDPAAELASELAAELAADRGAVLGAAHATAAGLGAGPLVREIELLAVTAGVPLRDPPADEAAAGLARFRLTRREREVLTLLQRGLSNRRIARALSIAERTASVHVSNILGKLGVGNRTAAAAVANQFGW